MYVETTAQTVEVPKPRRALASTLGLAALASLVFVGAFALRYFMVNEEVYDQYWRHRWWLLVHIAAGIVAIFTGPLQLWWGLTDRRMALHRQMGIVYMASIAIGAPTGLYLAVNTENGYVAGSGLAVLSLAWALTTGMAYIAIRRHLYDQHKEWMIRSYVVTTAFIMARLGVGFGIAGGITDFRTAFGAAVWASFAIPLLVTELVLQGRKILAVRA